MIRKAWRHLVWLYDGKPDPRRTDHLFLRHVGMGLNIRLPGERARTHRHLDEAREQLAIAHRLDTRGTGQTERG